jgi:hypothetical protein
MNPTIGLWSPRPVIRERDRVRAFMGLCGAGSQLKIKVGPHPNPLPEYRARGKFVRPRSAFFARRSSPCLGDLAFNLSVQRWTV